MGKIGGILCAFVVLGIIVFMLWAIVFPPDYSTPPTATQEALGALICIGVPAAIPLMIVFMYLESCYNTD